MTTLFLVRHGQASFGQENYDQLSELGVRQSHWLGEYLTSVEEQPELIIRGDLARHQQTAQAIQAGMGRQVDTVEMAGWNEFDFKAITYAYLREHPDQAPEAADKRAFFACLKKALLAWSKGEITNSSIESWQNFQQRIELALQKTLANHQCDRVLVVSSGGAISMAIGLILDLAPAAIIDLNLQSRNTGLSEVFFNSSHHYLTTFNSLPHMTFPERRASITSA